MNFVSYGTTTIDVTATSNGKSVTDSFTALSFDFPNKDDGSDQGISFGISMTNTGAEDKDVFSNETFDTDATPIFYYTNFTVSAGGVLTVSGDNPLVIVADTINVYGTINVSGEKGHNASVGYYAVKAAGGGAGGGAMLLIGKTYINIHSGGKLMANGGNGGHAGGYSQGDFSSSPWGEEDMASDGAGGVGVAGGANGGDGGVSGQPGSDGGGTGGGGAGPYHGGVPPGAGGGGYGTAGQQGFSSYAGANQGGDAGVVYGDADITTLYGGSGGGGGGNDNDNEEGAGGGGSGGSIYIYSPSISNNGTIDVSGGLGGCDDYDNNLTEWTPAFNNGGKGGYGRIRMRLAN